MSNFGPPITRPGLLDFAPRLKNRLITRAQYRILKLFGRLPEGSALSRLFSRTARRLIGGYIYSIKIEVNDYCDLKCRMCYMPATGRELDRDSLFRLLDQVRGCGVRIELLGGEPLMHPDIVEIVRYAKSHARSPFVQIYTNGTHAGPEMAERLAEAGLDAAIISLISNRREVQDEFTGVPGSWSDTIAGLRNLQAAGVETYTFTAVHQDNYRDYREIYGFVKEELASHALFYRYIPQTPDDPLMITAEAWRDIKYWILLEKNIPHSLFLCRFFMLTGNACSGGNFVFTVKVDGTVQPCPFMSDIPLGNIEDDDVWTIFRHRYRHTSLLELKGLPEACHTCSYRSVCGGGCRAGNRIIYGTYDHADHLCPGPWSEPLERDKVVDRLPVFF